MECKCLAEGEGASCKQPDKQHDDGYNGGDGLPRLTNGEGLDKPQDKSNDNDSN